jgi:predicted metal-dependent hydrolase
MFGFPKFKPFFQAKPVIARKKHPLDGLVLHAPVDGGLIAVDIRANPRAERLILRLDRVTGRARLTVPRGVGKAQAERFLFEHVGWIKTRLKALEQTIPFVAGAVIPILGVDHIIRHIETGRGVTRITQEDGQNWLIVSGASEQIGPRVLRFLKAQALEAFTKAATRHAQHAGVTLGKITIKDTKSRWGSCSAKGDLAFSWRLILAPPEILDYLAAHEVAHRLEMNHSSRYWRHVARLCPDYPAAETWLNRQGARLYLYGRG